jgi:hypothetical protein
MTTAGIVAQEEKTDTNPFLLSSCRRKQQKTNKEIA